MLVRFQPGLPLFRVMSDSFLLITLMLNSGGKISCGLACLLRICYNISVAPVAQWIRASVFGTEGRRFESYRVYQVVKLGLIQGLFCDIKPPARPVDVRLYFVLVA